MIFEKLGAVHVALVVEGEGVLAGVGLGFMQVLDAHHIRLRVFERGTGETQACGTGACAAAVAGMRAGLLARHGAVCVSLPGGDLQIEWAADNHVLMAGPAATVFEGTVTY